MKNRLENTFTLEMKRFTGTVDTVEMSGEELELPDEGEVRLAIEKLNNNRTPGSNNLFVGTV